MCSFLYLALVLYLEELPSLLPIAPSQLSNPSMGIVNARAPDPDGSTCLASTARLKRLLQVGLCGNLLYETIIMRHPPSAVAFVV